MEQQEDSVGPRVSPEPEFPLNSRIWRTLSLLKWNMLDIDIRYYMDIIWILSGYYMDMDKNMLDMICLKWIII